jgi:hypothetical protein
VHESHYTAEIRDQANKLLARGSAIYMEIPLSKITAETNSHPADINVMIPDDVKEIA